MNGASRTLSSSTSAVKFLGPNRSSTMQTFQQQQQSAVRLKLGPDVRMSDRQVIQSEPARPKPQWSDDEDDITNKKKETEEDDGFDDIFQ